MDLASVNKRIDNLEHDFNKELDDIDASMVNSFTTVKSKFKEMNAKLESSLTEVEILKATHSALTSKLVVCMFGFGFSSALSVLTLLLYLSKL